MAHCAPSTPFSLTVRGLVTPGQQSASGHSTMGLASIAPGSMTAFSMRRGNRCESLATFSSFLGNAGLFAPLRDCPFTKRAHRTKFVCLFGRGRQAPPSLAEQDFNVAVAPPSPAEQDFNVAVVERKRNGGENVPLVSQPVQLPFVSRGQYPPAAAFFAAIVFAGLAVLAVKVVNRLRGVSSEEKQPAFVGFEEDAAALTIARARLAQAFGDDPNEYTGAIVGTQIASMMGSAVDYLYALANEVAEMKAVLDDKEERLAFAVEKSRQDADERKELIRRISIAEAELVEEQVCAMPIMTLPALCPFHLKAVQGWTS